MQPDPRARGPTGIDRRSIVVTGFGVLLVQTARATPDELLAAVTRFSGGASVRAGRVEFDIAPLVENGNSVPITIDVVSPMSATDHVQAIAVFNERNPQSDVALFTLGPRAGRARVSTRIRLATSQQLVAVARMNDGSFWSRSVDVVVTLAACIE
jgi:sulfur-oxidizing protein SoxY